MKTLPPGLAAHLKSGATTLCWCWRLECRDGSVLGFTDHDRDVAFGGTTYEAVAGFTATEIKDQVGLSVDNLEVESALSSGRLTEADLGSGRYDAAEVQIFRVNWQSPDQRLLMRSGSLGEVRRSGQTFAAEVRGLAHHLQQPKGRLFQYGCDADLGDARCGVDLTSATHRATAAVTAVVSARRYGVHGIAAFADGWFTRGLCTVTSGSSAGFRSEIKAHGARSSLIEIELWQEPPSPLAIGDGVALTAGCDKQLATCRDKFANALRFRGFPHMPGNDFVASFANREGA